MKYSIGQILYVLMNRDTKICPVQVIEEITKRSLNGETTNYIVRLGNKSEPISLSDLDGQVFDSIEVLRQTLYEKTIKIIDSVIENSEKRACEWYTTNEINNEQEAHVTEQPYEDDDAIIVLPDGTKAKIKIPFSKD
jgi:hypothetical protein